jgi:toxin ParE1/3/4
MMYRVILSPQAEQEATDATLWYNSKSKGLGEEFLVAIDEKLKLIQQNPLAFRKVHSNVRRALTTRFPFAVFFIVENYTVYILAIIHTARHPQRWMKR